MNTPNCAELLVKEAKEAERLRLLLKAVDQLVAESTDIDELRREYDRLKNQQ